MKILIFLLLLLLSGCAEIAAQNDDINALERYGSSELPKAKAGDIKWSEYYRGLYKVYESSSFPNKGFQMTIAAETIDKAIQYESGKITKDEFEVFRLKQKGLIQKHFDESNQQALPPPVQPIQLPRQTNCTSNKVGNTVYTNCN